MKVMWFTNTPSACAEALGEKGGHAAGWIAELDRRLSGCPQINLAVAFPWHDHDRDVLKVGRTKYYPFRPIAPRGKIAGLIARWKHFRESEEEVETYVRLVEDFKPDLIHIFGTERPYGLMISRVSVPVVIHIQGNLTSCRQKWFSGITSTELLRYSTLDDLLKGRGLFHDYIALKELSRREKKVFEKCQYFMGRTDWDRRLTRVLAPHARYYHTDEMLRESFRLNQWKCHQNRTKSSIVTVIRNDVYKGLETLCEAAPILQDALGDTWTMMVAGISIDDEIVQVVQRMMRRRGGCEGVRLMGTLGEKELLEFLLDADLFVYPSHVDNSPNSLCEAMALGMPIVSTGAGGIPSLLRDGQEGVLVQDGDPIGMAGAIIELLDDRELSGKLGRRARERAIERHSPEKIVTNVLGIYQDILEREKGD